MVKQNFKLFILKSDRLVRERNEAYAKNVDKRGKVSSGSRVIKIFNIFQKKDDKFPVGPVLLGFFLFVVVGSGKISLNYSFIPNFKHCHISRRKFSLLVKAQ